MTVYKQKNVSVNNINFSNLKQFVLIAGPCAIESMDHAINITGKIKDICNSLNIEFVYKSSFDKVRSSIQSQGSGFRKINENI